MTTNAEFWKWVDTERQIRGLSYRAMEKIGGVANGTISGRASDLTSPTYKNCEVIAAAFELPIHTILKKAGILPDYDVPNLTEITYLMQQLPDEIQRDVLAYARFRLSEELKQDKPSFDPDATQVVRVWRDDKG